MPVSRVIHGDSRSFTEQPAALLTLAYAQRRRAEGKTDRDIRRCIKRYLARHLYRALNKQLNQAPQTT
jgi:hypothetical protein